MKFFFPIGTDFYIRFKLQDQNKALVSGATVSGQMYDYDGDAVGSSVSGNAHATISGNYEIVVPSSLSLVRGDTYEFLITITASSKQTQVALRGKAKYQEAVELVSFELRITQ